MHGFYTEGMSEIMYSGTWYLPPMFNTGRVKNFVPPICVFTRRTFTPIRFYEEPVAVIRKSVPIVQILLASLCQRLRKRNHPILSNLSIFYHQVIPSKI